MELECASQILSHGGIAKDARPYALNQRKFDQSLEEIIMDGSLGSKHHRRDVLVTLCDEFLCRTTQKWRKLQLEGVR